MTTEPTAPAPLCIPREHVDGEPCGPCERRQAHAEGEHELCGPECSATARAPMSPGREQEIRQAQPGAWLPGPWTIRDIEGTADEPGRWELVHHQSGTVLATLPDWAGNIALWAADAHDAVQELLAELDRERVESEKRRQRMAAAEADLLDIRGTLSPNGLPRRVPMELGATIAPVIEWLLNECDELRTELDMAIRAKQENDERFQIMAAEQRERANKAEDELDELKEQLLTTQGDVASEALRADKAADQGPVW
jgi:hypothetical protein